MVGKPNEGNNQHLIGIHLVGKQVLLMTIGLTNLPLHAIAVDGMMKPLLRNTNEHLNGRLPFLVLGVHKYDSQREGSHRMAMASVEELVYQFLTDNALLFLEYCWSRHKIIYNEG